MRSEIEPWITSLLASEHLSLLIGSGLTTALTTLADADPVDMAPAQFDLEHAEQVDNAAQAFAKAAHRGEANIEDQVRAALDLIAGLRVMEDPVVSTWETTLTDTLKQFATRVLAAEAALQPDTSDDSDAVRRALDLLASFLASFVSRTATKERLHIFTTNYDRVVEIGLDEAGVWKIDRFVGSIAPKFRASRLELDLHYSPPGIRGEPHYLEGVARLTKLHGSIDWFADGVDVGRIPIPFGTSPEIFNGLLPPEKSLLIYPNPAKDVETGEYPYAELFRDFSAAIVRPDSVLVTYGYGFGDDHINRVIRDMLSVPSTHLLVMSYGDPNARISNFIERAGRANQISVLLGPHLADLEHLVHWYLPRPSIDRISARETALLQRRGLLRTEATESNDDTGAALVPDEEVEALMPKGEDEIDAG